MSPFLPSRQLPRHTRPAVTPALFCVEFKFRSFRDRSLAQNANGTNLVVRPKLLQDMQGMTMIMTLPETNSVYFRRLFADRPATPPFDEIL